MRTISMIGAGLLVMLGCWAGQCSRVANGADVTPLKIGDPAPDFRLPGVDGRTYSLSDFKDKKILVVVFTCNHCPTAQAYEDRLIKLYNDFKDKSVALVAISPNDPKAVRLDELGYTDLSDSFEEMKIRAKDKKFPFPYLYDGDTQEVSRAFGVLATPHVFIFDQQRRLRYAGRIDKSHQAKVESPDARNAIEALLAGRPVPVPETRPIGCSTKWASKRASAKEALARWDREPVRLDKADVEKIKALVRNPTKKYRLITVWATWCGSCVTELPEFVTMYRMYRKRPFELITITLDDAQHTKQALETLQENHVSCPNYQFPSGDLDQLAAALDPQWKGAVPYTILVAPGGKILQRWHGSIDPLTVRKAIVERLGRTY